MDETAAHDRQWAYHPRWLPDTWSDQIQPLRISESSGCTAQIDIIPILTNDATEGSERIRNYHLFEGCSLEFRWPVGSKDVERTYEQFVERNIMLGHSPDTMRPISRFHRSDGN